MAKFGIIQLDEVIFKDDKVRIDVSKSFASPDESQSLTLSITPSGADSEIDVASGYLDWIYSTVGNKTVSLTVSNTEGDATFTKTINVLDLEAENLFSNDDDLIPYEPTIKDVLPLKWSSFNVIHYKVKTQIKKFIKDKNLCPDEEMTDSLLMDITEVNELACLLALNFIYAGAISQDGDYFSVKAKDYYGRAETAAIQLKVRLDRNQDGKTDHITNQNISWIRRV